MTPTAIAMQQAVTLLPSDISPDYAQEWLLRLFFSHSTTHISVSFNPRIMY